MRAPQTSRPPRSNQPQAVDALGIEDLLLAAVDEDLEVLREPDDLVRRRLVDAAQHVVAGVDAGHEAARRREDLALRVRVDDPHPRVVERAVLGVQPAAPLAHLVRQRSVGRVEHGDPVAHPLGVAEQRVRDVAGERLVGAAPAGRGARGRDDRDVVEVLQREQTGLGAAAVATAERVARRRRAVVAAGQRAHELQRRRWRIGDRRRVAREPSDRVLGRALRRQRGHQRVDDRRPVGDRGAHDQRHEQRGAALGGRPRLEHARERERVRGMRRQAAPELVGDEAPEPRDGHVDGDHVRAQAMPDEIGREQYRLSGSRCAGVQPERADVAVGVEVRLEPVQILDVARRAPEADRGGRLVGQQDRVERQRAGEHAVARPVGHEDVRPDRDADGDAEVARAAGVAGFEPQACRPGRRQLGAGDASLIGPARRRREDPRHVEAAAAVLEERTHAVGEVVGHLDPAVRERVDPAVDALEVEERGQQRRRAGDRSEACRADEPCGARADALDRLLAEAHLLRVDAGC